MTTAKLTFGVSGDQGSFSEEACLLYCEEKNILPDISYLIDMEGVLAALAAGQITLGIFPVVNLSGGLVRPAFDAMGKYAFTVVDEYWLTVNQSLLVNSGVQEADITQIVSHQQGLKQCRQYLKQTFPHVPLVEYEDTAKAARDLSCHLLSLSTAVIASKKNSELYHLTVLAENIQDMNPNLTAFIIVKR